MDYPPTPETFLGGRAITRGGDLTRLRASLSRWLGVAALACLAAGMSLTSIDIEMSSTPLMMLALPDLKMSGAQAFGPLGILSLAFTAIFVLSLFSGGFSPWRRLFGFCAVALWLATLVLAAVEVNTAFEAVLATMAILNRGETAPDFTAQLTPMLAFWLSRLLT